MQSTFQKRHGHDKVRTTKKSNSAKAKARRLFVLHALENQLELGLKQPKKTFMALDKEPLTDADRARIKKEIEILKTRI